MTRIVLTILFLILSSAAGIFANPMGMQEVSSAVLHYMGIIKVYEATLYADTTTIDSEVVLAPTTSRCLKLHYAVSFTTEDFIAGGETVMKRQHSADSLEQVQKEIDLIQGQFRDVKKGDVYTLCYDAPSTSTTLFLNNEQLITIQSAKFAAIYFGIWLGPTAPLDEDLRDELLEKGKKGKG